MTPKKQGSFRLLIVEDDLLMLEKLRGAAQATGAFTIIDTATDLRGAQELLGTGRYHFVSVDQNMPDTPGELILPDVGLKICQILVANHPLTNRRVYTGNGRIRFANFVGGLDETRYVEKRANQHASDSKDPDEYIDEVARELREDYAPWALVSAARRLPNHLASFAHDAAIAWRGQDWTGASRAVAALASATMELTWAQTLALARAADLPRSAGTVARDAAADRELDIGTLWPRLDGAGWVDPWRRVLADGAGDSTTRPTMLNGAAVWRRFRNDLAHERVVEVSKADFDGRLPAVLMLLDILAAWVETPLVEAPRRHPRQRGLVQFNLVAGAPPWELGEARDDYDSIPDREGYFMRWVGPDGPLLLDLHPFVFRTRNGPRHEPYVLISTRRGKDGGLISAEYRSLVKSDQRVFNAIDHRALLDELSKQLG